MPTNAMPSTTMNTTTSMSENPALGRLAHIACFRSDGDGSSADAERYIANAARLSKAIERKRGNARGDRHAARGVEHVGVAGSLALSDCRKERKRRRRNQAGCLV